jgi:hypothetical protein
MAFGLTAARIFWMVGPLYICYQIVRAQGSSKPHKHKVGDQQHK